MYHTLLFRTHTPTGAGLGEEHVAEVKQDDDEFDLYRKRMMLAYKFRPNPLVSIQHPTPSMLFS